MCPLADVANRWLVFSSATAVLKHGRLSGAEIFEFVVILDVREDNAD